MMLAGRYRIGTALGEGGQARVFAGVDTWDEDREVAIKRVEPSAYEVLASEFEALRSLRHPALVRALDLVVDTSADGAAAHPLICLVEERIAGSQLLHWAEGRDRAEVFAVLAPIAHALAHLHARGLAHLDPSPRNILVAETEGAAARAVLIDLGLARPFRQPGAAGTPGFIAPELLAGAGATAAADVYAFGMTLAVALGADLPGPAAPVDLGGLVEGAGRDLVTRCIAEAPASRPDAITLAERLCVFGGVDEGDLFRPQADVPLIGRSAELAAFSRWLASDTGVLRIAGVAGIGKTAFVDGCADQARLAGLPIWQVAGDDPRAPQELVRQALITLPAGEIDALPATAELRDLAMSDHLGDPSGGPRGVRSTNELGEMLVLGIDQAVGRGKALLLIDDADALPPALERAVEAWRARRVEGGLRVVLAGRSDAVTGERAITLGPLGDEAVNELLRVAYAGRRPAAEAERLVALCGRTPAALRAGLTALAAIPGTVFDLDASQVRLAGGSAPAAELCPLALVRGAFTEQVMRRIVGERGAGSIAASLDAGFLEPTGSHGARLFRVPEARRAPLLVDGGWHAEAHRTIAAAFDGEGDGLRAAPHWAAAGEIDAAIARLRLGDDAVAGELLRGIAGVAAAAGAESLTKSFDVGLLRRWGHLAGAAARVEDARTVAKLLAERDPDAGHLAVATALIHDGHYGAALEALVDVGVGVERAAQEAAALLFLGRTQEAHELAAAHWQGAIGEARADLLNVLGHAAFGLGHVEAAEEALRRGLAEARELGTAHLLGRAEHSLAIVLHRSGNIAAALPLYRAALAKARGLASVPRSLNLATALQDIGELAEARTLYRRAHSRAIALANVREEARVGVNLANLEILLGELAVGSRLAAETIDLCVAEGMHHAAGMAALVATEAAIERGAVDEARAALDRAGDLLGEIEDPVAEAERRLLAARLQAAAGDTDAALVTLEGVPRDSGAAHLERHRCFWRARIGFDPARGLQPEVVAAARRAVELSDEVADGELAWRARTVLFRALQAAGDAAAQEAGGAAREALGDWRGRLPEELHAAYFSSRARRQLLRWIEGSRASTLAVSTMAPGIVHLRRLVGINRRLAREQNVGALLEQIVDAAIELLGGERGFLILADDGDNHDVRVAVARNFDRHSLEAGTQRFSRSIAMSVLERGEAVLTTNAQEDERFATAKSVAALRLRSVICVPLRGTERDQDRLIGAIYLDHRFQERAFTAGDVELCESFADQTAIALENARLLERTRVQEQNLARQNDRLERFNAELQERAAGYAEEAEAALRRLREEGPSVGVGRGFDRFVGRSDALREALRMIDRFADTDVSVLACGESGTGKELVARALHERSRRRDKSFVSVNCGAIPQNLIESELFGYTKGAFTGAVRDKAGLFAAARGGTIFFDEIGEMPLTTQVKLLRVLQEREYRPVGATQTVPADARVVSASNAKLEDLVEQGRFREDLYYRIKVVEIVVPPLRERREDIPLLVDHFCREDRATAAEEIITRRAMGCLLAYDWPGNVRELANEVHRALALADGAVDVEDLSERLQGVRRSGSAALADLSRGSLKEIMNGFEREVLLATLKRTGWNVRQAAKDLGLSRAAIYTRLNRFGITRDTSEG